MGDERRIMVNRLLQRHWRIGVLVLIFALYGTITAQQDNANTAWRQHTTNGITLSAPATWLDLRDSQEFATALEVVLAINPDLAPMMPPASGVDFFLFDPQRALSLNMTTTPVQSVISLIDIVPALEAEYIALGFEVVEAQVVGLPTGNAAWIYLRPTTTGIDGNLLQTSQMQYLIPDEDRLIFITMSAPPDTFIDYVRTFAQIADTVEIQGTLNGWSRLSSTDLSIRVPFGWRSRSPQTTDIQIATGLPDNSATLTLAVTVSESVQTIATMLNQLEATYREQGREVIQLERVRLPSGEFVRGETRTTLNGSEQVIVDYVGVASADSSQIVTASFTVDSALAEARVRLFSSMMHTLWVQ